MLSKECEYAVKIMIYLSQFHGVDRLCNTSEIAQKTNSPESFTAKILQKLIKNNLVLSVKGVNGGFYIPTDTFNDIVLADIIQIFDGEDLLTKCVLGLNECSSINPCPMHQQYYNIKLEMNRIFRTSSLKDLSKSVKDKNAYLIN